VHEGVGHPSCARPGLNTHPATMSQRDNTRHIHQISRVSDARTTSGYVTIAFSTTELHKRSGSTAHGPTTLILAERSGPPAD
jgi:hypothetical protein